MRLEEVGLPLLSIDLVTLLLGLDEEWHRFRMAWLPPIHLHLGE